MDSQNRNTFKKKKKFLNPCKEVASLATVGAETGSRAEQMLCTLDRVSSAGRNTWKHLKHKLCLGFQLAMLWGEKSQDAQCQKLYVPSKSVFFPTNWSLWLLNSKAWYFRRSVLCIDENFCLHFHICQGKVQNWPVAVPFSWCKHLNTKGLPNLLWRPKLKKKTTHNLPIKILSTVSTVQDFVLTQSRHCRPFIIALTRIGALAVICNPYQDEGW